jgi:DNA-binding SARP family transcriptional activator
MAGQRLHIRLLGGVSVAVGDIPIRLGGRHAIALVALLALRPQRRSRESLVADLWPDAASASSLRQSLWLVRSGFASAGLDPDRFVETGPDTIGLADSALAQTDAARFERLARGASTDVEAAIELYCGDLVEGFGHECFAADRERLADLYEDCLAVVAERRLRDGDLDGSRRAAEQLLARDPLREEAHSVLIAGYGWGGTRSQVVRQYRRLTRLLRRELDVDPLPETETVYRTALATTVARSRQAATTRVMALSLGRRVGTAPAGRLSLAPTG